MVQLFGLTLHLLACTVTNKLSRDEAAAILDRDVLPTRAYGERIKSGRNAQGLTSGQLVNANDPVLARTYGEFPVSSMDLLLDSALQHVAPSVSANNAPLNFVDLGSGCGRLCIYAALTRGGDGDEPPKPWKVQGVEISDILHKEAERARDAAVDKGWLKESSNEEHSATSLSLALGPAEHFVEGILQHADLIFTYCTTWTALDFSEETGAMILSKEWNDLFSKCRPGCVVVTTDRALDQKYGWKLLERHDVPNPEVFESTGYIQILEK